MHEKYSIFSAAVHSIGTAPRHNQARLYIHGHSLTHSLLRSGCAIRCGDVRHSDVDSAVAHADLDLRLLRQRALNDLARQRIEQRLLNDALLLADTKSATQR